MPPPVGDMNCLDVERMGWCNQEVEFLVKNGQYHDGILTTALQCPQCGCGAEGAANLSDLLDAEVEMLG